MRLYLNTILSPHVKVYSACDGQEALEMAIKHRPDLIVTDVQSEFPSPR